MTARKRIVAFFWVLLAVCSVTGLASAAAGAWATVVEARQYKDGKLIITVAGNNNGCGGTRYYVTDEDKKDRVLSIALAALLSGKEVVGSYVTCSDNIATIQDLSIR